MKNRFLCPNCQSKQAVKWLFTLSKTASWKCSNCNNTIKPKNPPKYPELYGLIGVLTLVGFPFYSTYILDFSFIETVILALTFGASALLILWIYTYLTTVLDKVE